MTREQGKQNLISIGIAEPTDEQVTNYLNQVNGAAKVEKDRADKLKADADKAAELQAQLDEINNKGLSEVEKANKATEAANKQISELTAKIKMMETKSELAKLGIIGDNADKLFKDGNLDFGVLGQILTDAKSKAASDKEAEIAGKATNPGSGNPGNGGGDVSEGAKYAQMFNAQYAPDNGASK